MEFHLLRDLKNCGSSPPIYFKPGPIIVKKNNEKQDSFKVKIKTQSGNIPIKAVSLYIWIFNTGSSEALLRFLIILKKIYKGYNMKTFPHVYSMTNNILPVDALRFF